MGYLWYSRARKDDNQVVLGKGYVPKTIEPKKVTRTTRAYSATEAIQNIAKGLVRRLNATLIEGAWFGGLIGDDSDGHSTRVAVMRYQEVFAAQTRFKGGGWIISTGYSIGNGYLREGVEQDLLLLRFDTWPIDKFTVDRRIDYNPIGHSGTATHFRYTYLVSQNGALLQQEQIGFNLSGWAAHRFLNKARDTRALNDFREGNDNPFSRFLPKDTRLDQYLVRELVTQILDYMYTQ